MTDDAPRLPDDTVTLTKVPGCRCSASAPGRSRVRTPCARPRPRSRPATATSTQRRSTATRARSAARWRTAGCRATTSSSRPSARPTAPARSSTLFARALSCCRPTTSTSGSFTGPGEGSANADMWRAFVEAREAGLAREIGVSNFDVSLIDEVTEATGAAPAVNQIEWSPLLFDAETLAAAPRSRHRAGGLQRPSGWHARASGDRGDRGAARAYAGPGDHSLALAARA